jgi:PAS domain-containing protein
MADDEEELLRSVALQNAQSILLARQRAEQDMLRAKEELERRTQELAGSLAMLRATLESTWDGILVTDARGSVTGFNKRFVDMWRVPREIMDAMEHRRILEYAGR